MTKTTSGTKAGAFIISWLWLIIPTSLGLWLLSRVISVLKFDWTFSIIIAGIFAAIFIQKKDTENDSPDSERPRSIKEFEKEAEYWKSIALKNMKECPLDLDFSLETEKLTASEVDFLRLKERFRHDKDKFKQIVEDWYDYAHSIYEIQSAREFLDVDMEDNAYDRFDERTTEHFVRIQEIEKRIEKELGKESHILQVNQRHSQKRIPSLKELVDVQKERVK